jgi:hypothetical protein
MKNYFVLSILLFTCFGCNDSNESLPAQIFSTDYQLANFNLSDEYGYWKIRRGNMSRQEESNDEVLYQFDEDIYSTLSAEKINLLNFADSNNGFDAQSAPAFCPIYAVALLQDSTFTIELLTFFGDIDTEAELYHFLSVGYSVAKRFEKMYKVILLFRHGITYVELEELI